MNADRLLAHYERIADAPDAIARLRRFILDLAVRGKLVPQDANDEPASELLKRIAKEKARLVKAGEARKLEVDAVAPEDEPFAVPPAWTWTRLGSIGDWGSGSTPPRGASGLYGGNITWLKSGELNDNRTLTGSEEKVTEAAIAKASFRVNKPGDVLIAMYGATIGKVAILAESAVTNQAVCGCTPFAGVFNQFLFLFLFSQREQLHSASEGGAQPNISKVKIVWTPFPLPPLAEQHRIVAKVDELMGLCDRLEAAREGREAVRDRLAAASLARLNAPDPEPGADPAKVGTGFASGSATNQKFQADARFALDALPALTTRPDQIKRLRQTILNLAVRGRLLEGTTARAAAVGDYRTLQNGYAFKSSWFSKEGVRLLRNANIGHGEIRWNDVVHLSRDRLSEFERFQLNEGDIVLTLDRPFIVTGTKVARITDADLPSLLLQRVGRFVETSPGLDDDYLFLWINSPHFNDQIDPGRSNGVPHISSKQVEAAEILVPPLAEQHRIVAKVDALMALCDRLEASLTATAATRRRLLDALLAEALAPVDARELEAAE